MDEGRGGAGNSNVDHQIYERLLPHLNISVDSRLVRRRGGAGNSNLDHQLDECLVARCNMSTDSWPDGRHTTGVITK